MRAGKQVAHSHGAAMLHQTGFAYIAILVALLLLSLGTQGVMTWVSQQAQRDREEALLQTGVLYAKAIGAYYRATPGATKRWPPSLEALLEDKRLLQVQRHLRELYPDPVTRQMDWELIRAPDGGIQGLHSKSTTTPIRFGPLEIDDIRLPAATRYADWSFVASADLAPVVPVPKAAKL